jgi:outer membrane lipoprotein carrier protein
MITTALFSSMENINSFEADFKQTVTDDKNKSLSYIGHVSATKPQTALWKYDKPVNKSVYINRFEVTIVEPEIEQVIIKKLETNFNFFNMIKNAKKIDKNIYEAFYKNSKFTIKQENNLIKSISYIDEFENNIVITFTNQQKNHKIDAKVFVPKFSLDFDVIRN